MRCRWHDSTVMFPRLGRSVSTASVYLVLLSLLAGSLAVPAAAAEPSFPSVEDASQSARVVGGASTPPTDRFIVKFRGAAETSGTVRQDAYNDAAQAVDVPVDEVKTTVDGAAVAAATEDLTAAETEAVLQELNGRPDVEYAEVDRWIRPTATPTDPFYGAQWGLYESIAGMRVDTAWDRSTGAGVLVAVIDTGITAHRDLTENVLPGYDFISDPDIAADGDGRDDNALDPGDWCPTENVPSSWHGTHVAGIVAAQANNRGVAGVAYDAKVQPLRALGACGGYESDIADAIVWAAGGPVPDLPVNPTPVKVINLSLGGPGACHSLFQEAIDQATERGAVVVVAAGNEALDAANSAPANCANVISVGATDREGARADYSNFGRSC